MQTEFRSVRGPCIGCNGLAKRHNRTCGKRACLAMLMHLCGLIEAPTVAALNTWVRASLIRQMTETLTRPGGNRTALVRAYAQLKD